MASVADHQAFLDLYRQYTSDVLLPAEAAITAFLERWRAPQYWPAESELTRFNARPSPIRRFRSRVKSPESVVSKIRANPRRYPEGLTASSLHQMYDCVAARVVVYFLSDLPRVDQELRRNGSLELSDEYRPIAYVDAEAYDRFLAGTGLERMCKPSGYSSVHYVLRITDQAMSPSSCPWFELQVRTLAQDMWSDVEHLLGYKSPAPTSAAIQGQFQILSVHLRAIDEHFELLYEELKGLQNEASVRDDDRIGPRNLPRVLSEIGLDCAQLEVDGMLTLLRSRSIGKVSVLKALATQDTLDAIRRAYLDESNRPPVSFEVLATLANLAGVGPQSRDDAIRAHMHYLRAWEKLQGAQVDFTS